MSKTAKITALGIYASLFLLPALIHVWPGEPDSKINYTTLQPLPKWPADWQTIGDFTADVDAYLLDHFGMRARYLKTANRIRYHVFNELMSEQITIGADGFIFYNSHDPARPGQMLYEVCNQAKFSTAYVAQLTRGFAAYLDYLTTRQVQAHVAIIPIKARVYPEQLPPSIRRWCEDDRDHWIDALVAGLNQHRVQVYHPLALMRSLKAQMQVYLPIYFHWHGATPQVIATDMMRSLWGIEPTRFAVEPQQVRETSDLRSHLIGLKFRNESVKFDYAAAGVVTCTGSHCIPGIERFFDQDPLVYGYRAPEQKGPVLLILADSFGQYITPHFIRGFARVVQVDVSHMKPDQVWAFHEFMLREIEPSHVLNLLHEGGVFGFNQLNQQLLLQQANQSEEN